MNNMTGYDLVGELSLQVLKMEAEIEDLKRENSELKMRMEKSQATGEISRVVNQVNDISRTIARVVEERSMTSAETVHLANDADKSHSEMLQEIPATTQENIYTQRAAAELARMAEELHSLMTQFKC